MRWQRGKFWQTAIIRKWQILDEKGKFRKNGEYAKKSSRLLPNIEIRWQKVASWQMAILRKLQIWQEFIGLAKIKTRSQKRHVDNCGFYENDKFCEIGEFGIISGLAKKLNETTEEAFLWFATTRQGGNVGDQFSRIINMKIEFGSQKRQMLLFLTTNMAAVTSSANQQNWQLAISRNWQLGHFQVPKNLTFKARLSAKPLILKWFLIMMQIKLIFTTKVSHLASFGKWDFWHSEMAYWENGGLGKNPSRVWQKLKWGDKEGKLDKWRL